MHYRILVKPWVELFFLGLAINFGIPLTVYATLVDGDILYVVGILPYEPYIR